MWKSPLFFHVRNRWIQKGAEKSGMNVRVENISCHSVSLCCEPERRPCNEQGKERWDELNKGRIKPICLSGVLSLRAAHIQSQSAAARREEIKTQKSHQRPCLFNPTIKCIFKNDMTHKIKCWYSYRHRNISNLLRTPYRWWLCLMRCSMLGGGFMNATRHSTVVGFRNVLVNQCSKAGCLLTAGSAVQSPTSPVYVKVSEPTPVRVHLF